MARLQFLTNNIVLTGVLAVAASLVIMAAALAVCVKVIEKRDYA